MILQLGGGEYVCPVLQVPLRLSSRNFSWPKPLIGQKLPMRYKSQLLGQEEAAPIAIAALFYSIVGACPYRCWYNKWKKSYALLPHTNVMKINKENGLRGVVGSPNNQTYGYWGMPAYLFYPWPIHLFQISVLFVCWNCTTGHSNFITGIIPGIG